MKTSFSLPQNKHTKILKLKNPAKQKIEFQHILKTGENVMNTMTSQLSHAMPLRQEDEALA